MKRASYRDAVRWIASEDDTEFMHDDEGRPEELSSVSCALVADLFDVSIKRVVDDLRRELKRTGNQKGPPQ